MNNRAPAMFIRLITLLGALSAWAAPQMPDEAALKRIADAMPEKPVVKPKKARSVLVFNRMEGFRHGCVPFADAALKIMGEKTGAFTATLSDDMAMFDADKLFAFDAVVFNNTTGLKFEKPEHRANLMKFVREGKGVIGLHAASDNFPTWPEGVALMGGQFDGHPWGAGGTWAVKLDDPGHPLVASFDGKGFAIKDEIYQVKGPYSRTTHKVLLSLDWHDERNQKVDQKGIHRADRDFAIAWIKREDKGRVFYSSLGHNNEVYWNPAVLAHYLAGIQYALGDLRADDMPSEKAK